jgi:uncharacterized radical SAM superfamily Fe-S cluster-containing enzyme
MPDQLIGRTTSLCAVCKRSVPAETWRVDAGIVLRKQCEEHGAQEALVAEDADWYARTLAHPPTLAKPAGARPVSLGCPFDCGPCESHEQNVQLPIVPITSACNLDCPVCYTHNRNEGAWHMTEGEMRALLAHLAKAQPDRRIINITGGEPTMHPQFDRLVAMAHEEGIHRITVSTHGMRFLKDEWLVEKLAAIDARVILSFDSFEERGNRELLGGDFSVAKQKVLDVLERHGVSTTLLPVLCLGVNDHEVARFVELGLTRDFIRSVELHTMTFTGQSGAAFNRAARYTPDRVLADLERLTGGRLRRSDFVPSPAAHPLCYQVTYLLRLDDGRWNPFPRVMEHAELRRMLAGALYLEPGPEMELVLTDVINRLWVGETECEDADAVLRALKRIANELFAADLTDLERMRAAERSTKAVYLHAHMDEETFDTDRIRQCPVGVREADGTNVPSCSYNVLFRERDRRYMTEPKAPLATLGKGRLRVLG